MSSREELLDLDESYVQQKLELLHTDFITSKYELIRRIRREAKTVHSQAARYACEGREDVAYYEAKADNLDSFAEIVEAAVLFDHLPDWWIYEFSIGCMGTALYIRHVGDADISGEEDNPWLTINDFDATYRLLQNPCALLSTEEYAAARKAAAGTVRVWIRRGKLRSAVKVGNAWKIPELAAPLKRGFSDASYEWGTFLEGIPDEFEFLREPGNLTIRKVGRGQDTHIFVYESDDFERKEQHLSQIEVEKLEAILIANPAVIYTGDTEYFRQ